MVECLTRDRGATGSSLTGVNCVDSLSKTHLSLFSNGSTKEDPSQHNRKLVDWDVKNQIKKKDSCNGVVALPAKSFVTFTKYPNELRQRVLKWMSG